MKVQEVMTKNVEGIQPSTTISEVAKKMESLDVGVLPVMQGNKAVGILTDRDITVRAVAKGLDPDSTKAGQIMTKELEFCSQDEGVREAARHMQDNKIRRLLVNDSQGKVAGIIALGDLAVAANEELSGKTLEQVSKPAQPSR